MNKPSHAIAGPHAVAGRTVAVLGTGTMGAPIARNLIRAGMTVRVWNRTPAKAEGLATDGALVATSPAAAAADIDVMITMLTDGAAVEQVMTGPHGALSTLGPETVALSFALGVDPHVFVSTIAGGPLASPYATDKATAMLDADFTPGFRLQHAAKDATLATAAAHRNGLQLPLTTALLERWHQAIASGHGQDDVASTITATAAAAAVG